MGLVESNRHHHGRYSTLRLDLKEPDDKRLDTPRDADSKADVLARAAALLNEDGEPEEGAGGPEAGESESKDDDPKGGEH